MKIIDDTADTFTFVQLAIYTVSIAAFFIRYWSSTIFDRVAVVIILLFEAAFTVLSISSVISLYNAREFYSLMFIGESISLGVITAALFLMVFEMRRVKLILTASNHEDFIKAQVRNEIVKWLIMTFHFLKVTLLCIINPSFYSENL